MKIFKLQLYVATTDVHFGYTEALFDLDSVVGYYYPVYDNDDKSDINLFISGVGMITVVAFPEVLEYLEETFDKKM